MLTIYLVLLQVLHVDYVVSSPSSKRSFTIDYKRDQFLKDGKTFRYIAGSIHYFRVPSYYWQDRLYKIKKAGLNAIQTYVAWNVHEPFKGDYRFSGDNDLVEFIKLAQKNDLLVVLRPGPYICAEWEYGGFPYWVMKEIPPYALRSRNAAFLKIIDKWLSVLFKKLRPLLYANGGPIISVQVENEYGSYSNDHIYMKTLGNIFRNYLGNDVVLFTTDGAGDWFLTRGAVPSLYTTIDFGPGGDPKNTFKIQRKYQPHGPLVNSEYYVGWLDHWGEPHSRINGHKVAKYLDKILATNASVSLFMFQGGTNFGFMNGANMGGKLQPQPTSYDYDAPLSEAGDPTDKYFLIQKVIAKYNTIPPGPDPKPTEKCAYGTVRASKTISMYDLLKYLHPVESVSPLSFENINIPYGYVLYRSSVSDIQSGNGKAVLKIVELHDRAIVLVDQVFQGILDHNYNNTIEVAVGSILDIFVENQGRINYGSHMRRTAKGILSSVTLNGNIISHWKMYRSDETVLLHAMNAALRDHSYNDNGRSVHANISVPSFSYFSFPTSHICDTFLKLDAWTKGIALLNGFYLGRYWTPPGPQRTLYVPKNILQEENVLYIFETENLPTKDKAIVEFVDKPIWTN